MTDETVASLPSPPGASLPPPMATSLPSPTATSPPTPLRPTQVPLVRPPQPTAPPAPTPTLPAPLRANGFALISGTQGTPVRVRTRPGTDQRIVGQVAEGPRVQVLAGPQAATGLAW